MRASLVLLCLPHLCLGFASNSQVVRVTAAAASASTTGEISTSSKAQQWKDELIDLATATNRGFQASREQRKRAKTIADELSKVNPTSDPASSYYPEQDSASSLGGIDLSGKWTLIYTDAPDITSLDTSNNPFAASQLGRIGQECNPPYIKNVIEWKRPEALKSLPLPLPFSGTDGDRILQKVVCEAEADPSDPNAVNLKLVGLDLEGNSSTDEVDSNDTSNALERIQRSGPATLLGSAPLELRGFLKAPFGKFQILYLDEDIRIIETYQGYLAVNERQIPGEEWF